MRVLGLFLLLRSGWFILRSRTLRGQDLIWTSLLFVVNPESVIEVWVFLETLHFKLDKVRFLFKLLDSFTLDIEEFEKHLS